MTNVKQSRRFQEIIPTMLAAFLSTALGWTIGSTNGLDTRNGLGFLGLELGSRAAFTTQACDHVN